MLSFKNYVRVQSLDEAYQLCQKRNNIVLGGMLWLKMQDRNVNTVIDLCDLGLDQIEETENEVSIGAMVSLRTLETYERLNALTQGAVRESVTHIVGVQFRNVATVGGSIYGRFGFSDVLTMFLVLDAKVELYHAGILSIKEFSKLPRDQHDILVRVIIPKRKGKYKYLSMRNTATDFPVLTCAVSKIEDKIICSIGARPFKASYYEDDKEILANGITTESAVAFAKDIAGRATFGSNVRGSAEYRKKICEVLVRRAVLALEEEQK